MHSVQVHMESKPGAMGGARPARYTPQLCSHGKARKGRCSCKVICLCEQAGISLGLDCSILCRPKGVFALLLDVTGAVSLIVVVAPGAIRLVNALVGLVSKAVCGIISAAGDVIPAMMQQELIFSPQSLAQARRHT